jgi:hypothetical protein
MNYEEEIMMMAHKGYITNAEEEKLITAVLESDIYQRRGL